MREQIIRDAEGKSAGQFSGSMSRLVRENTPQRLDTVNKQRGVATIGAAGAVHRGLEPQGAH